AARHLAAHAKDRHFRHPRRAGGGLSRRPRGGDVGAARPHQDHRRHQVRQERSPHLQDQGLRRQGRRAVEPGPRRGHQGGAAKVMKTHSRYLPLVLLAIFWEVAARLELVSSSALPPLSDVVVSWIDMLKTGELTSNASASLYRGAMGLFLAIVVGAVLGIFMAWWKPINVL